MQRRKPGCINKNKRRKVGKDRELNWSEEALGRFIGARAEGIPSGTVTMVGGVQTVIETGGKEEPTVRPRQRKKVGSAREVSTKYPNHTHN